MDLKITYQRCPQDVARVISAEIGTTPGSKSGEKIEIGLAEIATTLQVKGCLYTMTMAIKNGVTEDFVARVAAALAPQMGEDIHALCPLISALCQCFALMSGGKAVVDGEGMVEVFPSKQCPAWMRGYFDREMEE